MPKGDYDHNEYAGDLWSERSPLRRLSEHIVKHLINSLHKRFFSPQKKYDPTNFRTVQVRSRTVFDTSQQCVENFCESALLQQQLHELSARTIHSDPELLSRFVNCPANYFVDCSVKFTVWIAAQCSILCARPVLTVIQITTPSNKCAWRVYTLSFFYAPQSMPPSLCPAVHIAQSMYRSLSTIWGR